ncbi:MAG: hypothetical protein RI989_544, partial [Bacteroidota bacterium]
WHLITITRSPLLFTPLFLHSGGGGRSCMSLQMAIPKKNKFILVAIAIVMIAMGFYQEQAKVNVNFILEKGAQIPGFFNQNTETKIDLLTAEKSKSNFDYYYSHDSIDWLYSFSQSELSKLKWAITFASIATFTLLNILALKFLEFNKKEIKLFLLVEGLCIGLAIATFVSGKLIHQSEAVYPAVRGIMGIVQSPVLVLIFIPAKKLFNRSF